jgi:uncharacterized membrane protein
MVVVGAAQMSKPTFPPPIWMILVPIFLLAVFSILMPFLVIERQRPPDEGWKAIFYSNRDDPALFVPKRFGIGYTLNFANPWSWAVLVLISAMVAAPLIFSAAIMRHLPK